MPKWALWWSRRPWRTVLVCSFAALLALQGYLSFIVHPEPYPSIRMPSFGVAAASDKTFGVTFASAEATARDGTTRPISIPQLMEEFRYSTARPSYDYLFLSADPSSITPSVKNWLRDRIETTTGIEPTELRMCWQKNLISVVDSTVVKEAPCVWKVITL